MHCGPAGSIRWPSLMLHVWSVRINLQQIWRVREAKRGETYSPDLSLRNGTF